MQRAPDKSTAGFTLIEVMVAMTILTLVTFGLMRLTTGMLRSVADDRVRTLAAAAAETRIAAARQWPTYSTLDSALAGTEANTPSAGWTRVTSIVRTGGITLADDYKKVTVTVTGPGLPAAIKRSVTIAAP